MKNIIELNLGTGYEYSIRPYVTCATAAVTKTKSITYNNFSIVTGATIVVRFTYGNTCSENIQLKIGNTTTNTDCNHTIPEGGVQEFIYDGSIWRVVGGVASGSGASTSDIEGLFNK